MDATVAEVCSADGRPDFPARLYTELFNPNITLQAGGHHDFLVSGLMGPGTNRIDSDQ